MKHFGARASDARCSLRDYALQCAFLGLGALQPAPKRAAACVFWQRSGLGRAAAPIGALQRVSLGQDTLGALQRPFGALHRVSLGLGAVARCSACCALQPALPLLSGLLCAL